MSLFVQIFLVMLVLTTLTQFWLSFRHLNHVKKHRVQVPEEFAEKITLEEHQKAADYTLAKGHFGWIESIFGLVVLLFWTLGGGLNELDQWMRDYQFPPLWTGVAVILALTFIGALIDLPASLYRTFVIEEKFGFNKSTLKTVFTDMFKGVILGLIIGVPLIWVILWLMQSAGDLWWLYAWGVLTAFSLLMSWAFPTFIAPLFNQFTPLEEGEVLDRVTALLKRTGFNSKGIFVMDGSKRSGHGNAYFTGLGKNKRIVFFDTLLEQLNAKQVEAVLAHELGHFKRKHILKGMFVSMILTLVSFAILAWLMKQHWFYTGFHIETPSNYIALIIFMLISPFFTFFISPLGSWFSRKHEFEADAFAKEQASADDLISALVGMYKENASTLTPDPLHSAFYDSHPPASIRIAHLRQN